MKRSFRIIVFAVLAVTFLSGRLAYGGARAVVYGAYGIGLLDAKLTVGPQDGNLRVIFDYNPSKSSSTSTYDGSSLWIINPNGGVIGASNPLIPASVGTNTYTISGIGSLAQYLVERSNTVMYAQTDGNTTVFFVYGLRDLGFRDTTSFGVWTYNSSGALIAAAAYGPYSGVTLNNIYYTSTGYIVARWATGPSTSPSYANWVLDEYGSVKSATTYYSNGPFSLGKVQVNSAGQQIWPFRFGPDSSGDYTLNIWTLNASGSAIVNAQSYGPF
jgi:hypothetical protein